MAKRCSQRFAKGDGKRRALEPANSDAMKEKVAPKKRAPGQPKGPRIPVHEYGWTSIGLDSEMKQLRRKTESKMTVFTTIYTAVWGSLGFLSNTDPSGATQVALRAKPR